ncbi:MAG: alkaline phosphatase family protein, partial [Desulfobacterales bacterium]|nr:alkaline phosphatase family protein [Desulfobacterales bacterium]
RPDGIMAAHTPVMDRLMATGARNLSARTVMPALTLPCITSLFCSTTADIHGVTDNKWTPGPELPPSLFSVIRSESRRTASLYNWEELRDLAPVGALDTAIFIENCNDAGGTGDRVIARMAADTIRREQNAFTFVYLGHVDVAGHRHGYMSAEYLEMISAADESLGLILEAAGEDTISIVLADHGGHGTDHGMDCDEDMTIPVIMNGPGIPAGSTMDGEVSILDIAPTITALLGIKSPEAWQGRPVSFK